MLILLLFLCLIAVVGLVAGLGHAGMLPWFDADDRGSRGSGGPGMLENPGCLLAIMVACVVWFGAWGIVLVLSLRFLRSVI